MLSSMAEYNRQSQGSVVTVKDHIFHEMAKRDGERPLNADYDVLDDSINPINWESCHVHVPSILEERWTMVEPS